MFLPKTFGESKQILKGVESIQLSKITMMSTWMKSIKVTNAESTSFVLKENISHKYCLNCKFIQKIV